MDPNPALPLILPTLIANIQQSDGGPDILATINTLRMESKGNDRVKAYIGEQIGTHLVRLGAASNLEVALGSAKLLRSITVYRKNKLILQTEITSILALIQHSTRPLQIPLAAVIWNLSSLRPNRDILMQKGVLQILNTLLKIEGEVRYAAGATRNLTLDERYLENFAETEIIDTLIDIIPHANSSILMTCVLVALRNISCHERNQERIGTPTGIANLVGVLKKPSTDPSKDHKYVLETLALMSKNLIVRPSLADSKIEELLLPFVDSPNDFLAIPSKEILNPLVSKPES